MEPLFVLAFGVMIAASAYLLLSRNLLRMLLGLLLLSNAANLCIFIAGRLGSLQPPLVAPGQLTVEISANPLPQALILTAIVISFALVVYTMVLFQHAHRSLATMDTDAMRAAEPVPEDGESAPGESAPRQSAPGSAGATAARDAR